MNDLSWQELTNQKSGTILHDVFEDGLRFIVMWQGSHLCAYVGLPADHPLSGHSYDTLPVSCHGGLTFGQDGDGKIFSKGYFWYGWDYAHAGDKVEYKDVKYISHGKEWLVKDVVADSWGTLYNFGKLIKLSEAIVKNCKCVG